MSYNQNQGYYPQRQQHPSYSQTLHHSPLKKRSGAKEGRTKKDKIYVIGWNASKRRGMIQFKAFENKKTTFSTSKNRNEFATMMFEFFYKDSGNTILEIIPYNLTTGKAYSQKLGMAISTKAPNGGFFGSISRK